MATLTDVQLFVELDPMPEGYQKIVEERDDFYTSEPFIQMILKQINPVYFYFVVHFRGIISYYELPDFINATADQGLRFRAIRRMGTHLHPSIFLPKFFNYVPIPEDPLPPTVPRLDFNSSTRFVRELVQNGGAENDVTNVTNGIQNMQLEQPGSSKMSMNH